MSEKYAFIVAEYATNKATRAACAPSIKKMCQWVEVSASGFFEWKDRPPSATAERRALLAEHIKVIFDENDATYGYQRVHAELLRDGVQGVSDELVRRIMRDEGLVPCQVRRGRSLTKQAAGVTEIPDLVARDFTAGVPYTKLIGDITEIKTWEGKLYLATVIDCFNKEIIGYAMADHFRTELITDAITMAATNHPLAKNCVSHSDRGSTTRRTPTRRHWPAST
ncbi:MAG: integrase, catalytic region [Actinomycetia bacterium]|nr:integrase, catalytic region [Actinomycetes bacterium]